MSINRLMFIDTSVRSAPSTLKSRSITPRNLLTSASVSSFTRSFESPPDFSMILRARLRPMQKIYVRPISTFFSRGRSTPEIRAMYVSALSLLVLGVSLADDAHHATALHDLAVLADWLHARPNFHKELRSNGQKCPGETRTVIRP